MSNRPESWSPNEGHYELGGKQGLSRAAVLALVAEWTDYHRSKGTKIADFDASFRTWIRNSVKFGGRPAVGLQPPAKTGEFQWKRTPGA